MDKCLLVFLGTEDTIKPDQISNSICSPKLARPKLARNLLRGLLLPVDTHYCIALQWTNCLLLLYGQNISDFDSSVYSTCCHFSAAQFICFCAWLSLLALFPCGRCDFLAASLPWRPLLARLLQTVDGCTWVSLVSAKSELMALLDIFQFWRETSLMCFTSAALSFINWPLLS